MRSIENLIIYRSKNILRTRKKCEMIIKKLYEVFYDVNARICILKSIRSIGISLMLGIRMSGGLDLLVGILLV